MTTATRRRRRGRPRQFARAADAIALYDKGTPYKVVARQLGVSPETIRQTLIAAGVTMRPRGRPSRVAVDPIWGRLAWLMYRPRSLQELKAFELKPGRVRVDLGHEGFSKRNSRKAH